MKEIERKFLVNAAVKEVFPYCEKFTIQQGYLQRSKECTVRVRIKNNIGFLTVKSESKHYTRDEFEYEIPLEDAKQMLQLCGHRLIQKNRYEYKLNGKIWEIDVFDGKLAGLYLAEIELSDENETVDLPDWIEKEVSLEVRFTNSNLVMVENLAELNL